MIYSRSEAFMHVLAGLANGDGRITPAAALTLLVACESVNTSRLPSEVARVARETGHPAFYVVCVLALFVNYVDHPDLQSGDVLGWWVGQAECS